MTQLQRIGRIVLGLVSILGGLLLFLDPEDGVTVITAFLSLSLIVYGIRTLVYYLNMARYMVGGKAMLYVGIITMDFGLFMSTQSSLPRAYLILYLVGIHGFTGAVGILRALEARRFGAQSWRLNMAQGVVNLALALLAAVFYRSVNVPVYLYSLGLVYSGVMRIVSAFRRTAIVYIQ